MKKSDGEIATVLKESHYTDNPDVDVVGEIMRVYCDQEKWSSFCNMFLTEQVCRHVILNTYQYFPYYKQTIKLYQVRDKAKRDIFINLIKLNSEESKENLSLYELISGRNELTFKAKVNFDKVTKQNQEYKEKIKALKAEQENLEAEGPAN
nr:5317_t:CDS:2 [Entrophospora candida]